MIQQRILTSQPKLAKMGSETLYILAQADANAKK